MKKLTHKNIKQILKPREVDSHKGSHGNALLIAGSKGTMGAAVISARACLRTGVGLLSVNVPDDERFIIQVAIPEAKVLIRGEIIQDINSFNAIGIGPGLGTDAKAMQLLKSILGIYKKPMILDADALNLIASDKMMLMKLYPGSIMTTHPKEFDRLFGEHVDVASRNETALKISVELPIIIVLKGHKTHVFYEGKSWINTSGNSGLAKGGSEMH